MRLVGVFLVKVSTPKNYEPIKNNNSYIKDVWVNSNIFHRVACFFWLKKKNLKPTNLLKVSAAPYCPPWPPNDPPRDLCLEEFSDQDFESCPQAQRRSKISRAQNPPGWDSLLNKNHPKIDMLFEPTNGWKTEDDFRFQLNDFLVSS